jgi:hypothetical protein
MEQSRLSTSEAPDARELADDVLERLARGTRNAGETRTRIGAATPHQSATLPSFA